MPTVKTSSNYLVTVINFILLGDFAISWLLFTQRNQISFSLSYKSLMTCLNALYMDSFILKNDIGLFSLFQNSK